MFNCFKYNYFEFRPLNLYAEKVEAEVRDGPRTEQIELDNTRMNG